MNTLKLLICCVALALVSLPAIAVPTNKNTPPVCHAEPETLPIKLVNVVSTRSGIVVKSRGTTFYIAPNIWVTAAHVVQYGNIDSGTIVMSDGANVDFEVIHYNREKDIAVLYAETPADLVPLMLTQSPLEQYESVWAIGYPAIMKDALLSFEGIAFAYSENQMLVSTSLVMAGMSGGPQFRCNDGKLEVVAVIVAYLHEPERKSTTIDDDGVKTITIVRINSGTSMTSPHIGSNVVIAIDKKIAEIDGN